MSKRSIDVNIILEIPSDSDESMVEDAITEAIEDIGEEVFVVEHINIKER